MRINTIGGACRSAGLSAVIAGAITLGIGLAGCSDDDNVRTGRADTTPSAPDTDASTPPVAPAGGYAATIRTTTNGVPHILAADLASAAFG